MGLSGKRYRKCGILNVLFCLALFCTIVFLVLLLLNSKLPDSGYYAGKQMHEVHLGKIAKIMVSMLPDDLAFTIFVPSEEAFASVLNLTVANDLTSEKWNDTVAILSRVVGFSTIPQHLSSAVTSNGKEMVYDSISGFRLYTWKDSIGRLVVNDICSEQNDIWSREIIVHIMSGVIMDAEFEQAFRSEYR